MNTEKVKIGEVMVDSGQLMICDPYYIDREWQKETRTNTADYAHDVYRHKDTGELWQYTYGKPPQAGVNMFPGSYQTVIPQYGKAPNQLKESGEFILAKDIDPLPHITDDEFSYRAVCKNTLKNDNRFAEINDGLAAVFRPGFGDGRYEVFAETAWYDGWGKRIKRVTIELIPEENMAQYGWFKRIWYKIRNFLRQKKMPEKS